MHLSACEVWRSGQDFSILLRPVSLSLMPTLSLALALVTCLTLQFHCKSDSQSAGADFRGEALPVEVPGALPPVQLLVVPPF